MVGDAGEGGGADLVGLVGREGEGVADREPLLILACGRTELHTDLGDVLVRLHDHAEDHGRTAIEIDRLDLWGDVIPADRDDVGEPDQAVGATHPGQHGLDRPHVRKVYGRLEQKAGAVRVDVARRQHDVLPLKVFDQRVHLNADGGHLPGIEFEPYSLVLHPVKLDLGDADDLVKLLPEVLRRILQLAGRKPSPVMAMVAIATSPKSLLTKGPMTPSGSSTFASAILSRSRCQVALTLTTSSFRST
jgi:hypothetical protein